MRDSYYALLAFILCLYSPELKAEQYGDFTYSVANSTVTITRYTGASGVVDIPTNINSLPVTTIGNGAFYGYHSLTNITIPNSVTNIGDRAFYDCYRLTSITIGNSVTTIENYAFAGCSSLASITIPNSVTTIGFRTFHWCDSLTNITIPNSVTTIGSEAFFYCPMLFSITIGNSVTNIGFGAFRYCHQLQLISVTASNAFYTSVDGVLFNKDKTTLVAFPGGKAGAYAVPNSVTTIGDLAFDFYPWLPRITIGNSVTTIGYRAFAMCSSLTSIYFKGNAPHVGYDVFNSSNPTVYYLPGTTGWDATFAGRPTALWILPQPMFLQNNLGMRTNQFGISISWATNRSIIIEATTNLFSGIWLPIETNTLVNGTATFTDPDSKNHPSRFYRLRVPQ